VWDLSPFDTTAIIWPTVPAPGWYMMVTVEYSVEWELAVETEVVEEKHAPVPLCSPLIPHDLRWNPGSRRGNLETNRLSYGTTSATLVEKVVTLHTVRETMLLDPRCCCMYRIYRLSTNVYEHPEGDIVGWNSNPQSRCLVRSVSGCTANPRRATTGWTASSSLCFSNPKTRLYRVWRNLDVSKRTDD
jgi:hypothetical protein